MENESANIKLIRKYLKLKILEDNLTFRNHEIERKHIFDILIKTISQGESHSALVIGPRGCGKTTLINTVLYEVAKEADVAKDAVIVKLNGLIHNDDKSALKSITAQMQLENVVGDRVFGTFAENLSFLLNCLMSGVDRRCKSMVFILEEFDMFCYSGKSQTLLYNLFDITHSKQALMCVLGITNRIDVIEMLEKRVKSRFSHRHIFMFPNENTDGSNRNSAFNSCLEVLVHCLSMPMNITKRKHKTPKKKRNRKSLAVQEENMELDINDNTIQYSIPDTIFTKCKMDSRQFNVLDSGYIENWNAHIQSLIKDEKVIDVLEKFCYYTVNEQLFKDILFQVVSKLSTSKPYVDSADLIAAIDRSVGPEHRVKLLQSLSILELSLVIAMVHGQDIFDGQPMNFEMVLHRYTKFANANSSTQTVPRPVILKAFEHLHSLEVILPVKADAQADTTSAIQKEFKLYTLAVPVEDVREAIKGFKALPTEINHWFNNSVV